MPVLPVVLTPDYTLLVRYRLIEHYSDGGRSPPLCARYARCHALFMIRW